MFMSTTVTYNHNVISPKGNIFVISKKQMRALVKELGVVRAEINHGGNLLTFYENHENTLEGKRELVEKLVSKHLEYAEAYAEEWDY